MFKNKKIILGATGSIAAYKTAYLARELIKAGAEVFPVATRAAEKFIGRATLSNLCKNETLVDMFDEGSQNKGAWHIELVQKCDAMIIAPCTAATLGKIASGICDSVPSVLAIALPRPKPLLIAPAMDATMFANPATQRNIRTLENDGAIIIPPESGELSSGLSGPGRLPDLPIIMDYIAKALDGDFQANEKSETFEIKSSPPEEKSAEELIREKLETPDKTLADAVDEDAFNAQLDLERMKGELLGVDRTKFLSGKKVLVTAGPTYERIDDVRYIGNNSSGKMGFAIAAAAKAAGAEVELIAGPTPLKQTDGIRRVDVVSADEMCDFVMRKRENADLIVMAAAVADYTPVNPVKGKIKKDEAGDKIVVELQSTNDILAELGAMKSDAQYLIGFALESDNEIENGWKKLKNKNCDMIVVNVAGKPDSGFGGDKNTISILTSDGKQESFEPMSKALCAQVILSRAYAKFASGD